VPPSPQAKKEAAPAASAGDDEGVIDSLISKLEAATPALPSGYRLAPVQVGGVRRYH
jgi:hypothetical protein